MGTPVSLIRDTVNDNNNKKQPKPKTCELSSPRFSICHSTPSSKK